MWEIANAYEILIGKPEGKRSLQGPRCRWEGYINVDLGDIGLDGGNWIYLRIEIDEMPL
jgi:hypothetical protein